MVFATFGHVHLPFCMGFPTCGRVHLPFCMVFATFWHVHLPFCTGCATCGRVHLAFCMGLATFGHVHLPFCMGFPTCGRVHLPFCIGLATFLKCSPSILHVICYMWACSPSILYGICYMLACSPSLLHGIFYMWACSPHHHANPKGFDTFWHGHLHYIIMSPASFQEKVSSQKCKLRIMVMVSIHIIMFTALPDSETALQELQNASMWPTCMLGIYFKRALFCIVSQDFTNRHYMLQPMVDQSSNLEITLGWVWTVWKLFMLMNVIEQGIKSRWSTSRRPFETKFY